MKCRVCMKEIEMDPNESGPVICFDCSGGKKKTMKLDKQSKKTKQRPIHVPNP